jgi:putative Mn2+ efflux pump MntP
MAISRVISLVCIVFGGIVAVYAQAEQRQNRYLLIPGIMLLMIGIYRISRHIPSKKDKDESIVIETEEDENDKDRG